MRRASRWPFSYSEQRVFLDAFYEVQQEMWLCWWAGEWFETAGKASIRTRICVFYQETTILV